jgi:hypothetical protein
MVVLHPDTQNRAAVDTGPYKARAVQATVRVRTW